MQVWNLRTIFITASVIASKYKVVMKILLQPLIKYERFDQEKIFPKTEIYITYE